MNSHFALQIFAFLCLTLITGNTAIPSDEGYWNSLMHGAPMPKAIKDALDPEWFDDWVAKKSQGQRTEEICTITDPLHCPISTSPKDQNDPTSSNLFFLEKDLQLGTVKSWYFGKSSNRVKFMPKKFADMAPFTSDKIPDILDALFINPKSPEADAMRNTITTCDALAKQGGDKSCVTSLGSMLDFTTAKLGGSGGNVEPVTSEVERETAGPQSYTVVGLNDMGSGGKPVVACHKMSYPYAVFDCRKMVDNVKAYMVSLVGADGNKVKAVAICHEDTSAWSPNHLAFQILDVKPGAGGPVCQFGPEDYIVWIPK